MTVEDFALMLFNLYKATLHRKHATRRVATGGEAGAFYQFVPSFDQTPAAVKVRVANEDHLERGDDSYGTDYVTDTRQAKQTTTRAAKAAKAEQTNWVSLAKVLIAERIDPFDYMGARFHNLTILAAPLLPAAVTGPAGLIHYKTVRPLQLEAARVAWDVQLDRFVVAVEEVRRYSKSAAESWLRVLEDVQRVELSALFRYCMAISINQPDFAPLVQSLELPAALQLMESPTAYARAWANKLPRTFSTCARRLYGQVHGAFKRPV